jgi:hypothetical protein
MIAIFPAHSADVVESFGVCLDGWHNRNGLCFKLDFDCLGQYHNSYTTLSIGNCQVKSF